MNHNSKAADGLQSPNVDIFWGELAPCEHLVQIYEDDSVVLDTLEGFVAGGLRAGDAVIVIATEAHRRALEERLGTNAIDVDAARAQGRYIALDAQKTLDQFMVRDWPDEESFSTLISALIARARGGGRQVRAFGEMVALLWASGHCGATVRLEHLWHKICHSEGLSLFCAYPKSGFTQDADESIREICDAHSRVLAGSRAA